MRNPHVTHVMAFGLDADIEKTPKDFCHDVLTRLCTGEHDTCHLVSGGDVAKLSKPLDAPHALLVGLDHRPMRTEQLQWCRALDSHRVQVMRSHRLWSDSSGVFVVRDVAPNRHRIRLEADEQALYDLAVADDFRRRLARHHPVDVAGQYRQLGFEVQRAHAVKGLDQHPIRYSATIRLGNDIDPHQLLSMGRHARISGLLVPVAA